MKVQTRWDVPVQHSSRARRGSPRPSCVALSASVPSVPLTLPSHPHTAVKGLASEPQSNCAPPLLRALPGLLSSPVNLPPLPVAVSYPLPLIHALLTNQVHASHRTFARAASCLVGICPYLLFSTVIPSRLNPILSTATIPTRPLGISTSSLCSPSQR